MKQPITYELIKMFGGKNVSKALLLMDECNILTSIFPYFTEIKKIPNNSHHHLDLFHHLIESVNQIEKVVEAHDGKIKIYFTEDLARQPDMHI